MKIILVPIDLSVISADVVEEAALVARAFQARMVLRHVRKPSSLKGDHSHGGTGAAGSHHSHASAALAEFKESVVRQGIATEVEQLIADDPAEVILRRADQLGADYIIMGSHGHPAIYDLLVGSTAMAVLKRACQPVLLVGSNEVPNAEFIPPVMKDRTPAPATGASS